MPKDEDDVAPINAFKIWKVYEDVAMHFNDMLLRLRIQALAGVAALAILASVFSNVRTFNFQGTWLIASASFLGWMLVWLAIWLLDRCYYSRLLLGSVAALLELEKLSAENKPIGALKLSTHIDQLVRSNKSIPHPRGVGAFYGIVFATLLIGFCVTTRAALTFHQGPIVQPDRQSQNAPSQVD